jgi:hypothetical protein
MALRILIALTFLSAGCAGRTSPLVVPPSHRTFAPAPQAMTTMVLLSCGESMRGWGTPIGPKSIVTAYHVIDDCSGGVFWHDRFGNSGYLIVLGFKACEYSPKGAPLEGDCDWAHLVIPEGGKEFDHWAIVAREVPENGETLWWYLFLEGWVYHPVSGPFIGLDGQKRFCVAGTSYPGSSGSGLFNGDGELAGVLSGHVAPTDANYTIWGTRMAAILR